MAYQVIARKWRPQTFEEVTGQEAITRTLRNAVEHDRLHHAYIFSGARGVGKTTTARLLAKSLNCHKTKKPNPTPCAADAPAACVSCKEIAESRSIDVLEFDAASHTGVDDIREIILESININPARDRYKVFIIDEVHMLSNSSFNALLKTLEEPPPRVEFIMATTELHKVPDTILSRCQEFEFRTISLPKIFERLRLIADAEEINVSDEALKEIARAGEGSMRDAQSAFDQVISFSGARIGIDDVSIALGIAGAEMLTRVAGAISDNKPAEALKVVGELVSRGQDLRNFARDLMAFFRDLLVFKMAGSESENLLDTAILSTEEMLARAAPFSEADLIRFFSSLGDTETRLREATQPRYVLELGLIKLVEMRRVAPVEKILERLVKLENALAGGNFSNENSAANSKDTQPENEKLAEAPTPTISESKIPRTENAASSPIDLNDFIEQSIPPSAEKKTLTVNFPLEEIPFPVNKTGSIGFQQSATASAAVIRQSNVETEFENRFINEPEDAPDDFFSPPPSEPENLFPEPEGETFPPSVREPEEKEKQSTQEISLAASKSSWLERFSALPVKLPEISAEELEHVEDAWLDADFERKLISRGDDLRACKDMAKFVEILLGANQSNKDAAQTNSGNGNSAAAAFAPAKEKSAFVIPDFDEEEISNEMPVLPENPTDEQLWQYAENHPLVKKAMRIFRGKIIEVKRESDAR